MSAVEQSAIVGHNEKAGLELCKFPIVRCLSGLCPFGVDDIHTCPEFDSEEGQKYVTALFAARKLVAIRLQKTLESKIPAP